LKGFLFDYSFIQSSLLGRGGDGGGSVIEDFGIVISSLGRGGGGGGNLTCVLTFGGGGGGSFFE
jgi:hypothetical protein